PMVKRAAGTHYEPIEWDDAYELLALELNALPSPDAAAFYTSGRTSNEAAFLYQLFARQFGTNNLPDCSNMCHESSGAALKESILTYPVKMLLNRGTALSDLWLPVRINGDMPALRGIMKEMLAEEERSPGSVFDREFIEGQTVGFEAFVEHLRATDWEDILTG